MSDWGFDEWVNFQPSVPHSFSRTSAGDYACSMLGSSWCAGENLDEAARNSAEEWCRDHGIPVPFSRNPDLSSVESCLREITEAWGYIGLYQKNDGHLGRSFGERGKPWTLAELQAATRYVLGIDEAEEEKAE